MAAIPDLEIAALGRAELQSAVQVAARGMRDNPDSVAMFGPDPARRVRGLQAMFSWVLSTVDRPIVAARRQGHIVGIAAASWPDRCFYRQMISNPYVVRLGKQRATINMPPIPWRVAPSLLSLGPRALSRMSSFGELGLSHDPAEPHQHVELVAVEPGLQGLGIGSAMLAQLCRELDTLPHPAYLETDKPENVTFYRRFSFEVVAEADFKGSPNWYMQRPAKEGAAANR